MYEQEKMSNTLSQGKLSKIRFQSYPVDIAFRIERCEGRYTLLIDMPMPIDMPKDINMPERLLDKFPIQIREYDLVELSNALHEELRKLVGDNKDVPLTNADLRSLALAGYDAFVQVFGDIDQKYLAAIQKVIADRDRCFEIISDEFLFPWELIYSNSPHDEESVSIEHFWGLRHIIYRVNCYKTTSPTQIINSCPKLGLLAYEGLPAVKSSEIPQFYRYEEQKRIYLRHLCFTSTNFIADFRDFWALLDSQ
jgi:hypothetical protein